jgi:molecular chaperone GrpE
MRDEAQQDAAPRAASDDERVELTRDRDQYRDLLLRKTAEFDNYRKRIERERKDLQVAAASDLLSELLPIVDDFERALGAETGKAPASYRAGVELIYKQLLDLLKKRGVTPIDAVGQTFDPHRHQAVEYEESPDHRDGEVTAELRRGYMLGDRLLRPALVRVAKA